MADRQSLYTHFAKCEADLAEALEYVFGFACKRLGRGENPTMFVAIFDDSRKLMQFCARHGLLEITADTSDHMTARRTARKETDASV